jgi:hypothetical protein
VIWRTTKALNRYYTPQFVNVDGEIITHTDPPDSYGAAPNWTAIYRLDSAGDNLTTTNQRSPISKTTIDVPNKAVCPSVVASPGTVLKTMPSNEAIAFYEQAPANTNKLRMTPLNWVSKIEVCLRLVEPVCDIASGTYARGQRFTLTNRQNQINVNVSRLYYRNSCIRYTMNGSDPTSSSPLHTTEYIYLSVYGVVTVKAAIFDLTTGEKLSGIMERVFTVV